MTATQRSPRTRRRTTAKVVASGAPKPPRSKMTWDEGRGGAVAFAYFAGRASGGLGRERRRTSLARALARGWRRLKGQASGSFARHPGFTMRSRRCGPMAPSSVPTSSMYLRRVEGRSRVQGTPPPPLPWKSNAHLLCGSAPRAIKATAPLPRPQAGISLTALGSDARSPPVGLGHDESLHVTRLAPRRPCRDEAAAVRRPHVLARDQGRPREAPCPR